MRVQKCKQENCTTFYWLVTNSDDVQHARFVCSMQLWTNKYLFGFLKGKSQSLCQGNDVLNTVAVGCLW